MRNVLAFLDRIEGHGYGGTAEFEIARAEAREAASDWIQSADGGQKCDATAMDWAAREIARLQRERMADRAEIHRLWTELSQVEIDLRSSAPRIKVADRIQRALERREGTRHERHQRTLCRQRMPRRLD